jgi:hypothetical protein
VLDVYAGILVSTLAGENTSVAALMGCWTGNGPSIPPSPAAAQRNGNQLDNEPVDVVVGVGA